MKRTSVLLRLLALSTASAVVLSQGAVMAAQAASAPAPAPSGIEEFIKKSKQPLPWLSWGGDLRIRTEYFDTTVSLNEHDPNSEFNVIRTRGRIWTSITPITNLSFNARMAAEPRTFTADGGFGIYKGKQGTEWRYGILDNANVKWNNILDQPLSLTAGRQDIVFGDFWNWWLVADGTPGDGSWTYFLDSIRLTYDVAPLKTKLDLIYIYQNARADDWIPTIHRPTYRGTDYPLTEQNEQGVIAYASNKSIKNTTLDGYFIYKRDTQETFARAYAPYRSGDNANIYTFGARFIGTYADHWQPYLEGAYQFGNKEDRIMGVFDNRDLRAWGVNARLIYLFKDRYNNQLQLIAEHLSGDDDDTSCKDEMFDVLWGRWPRWSELYIYSYGGETSGKIAQLNNITRVGAGWSMSPVKGMTVSAIYNALFAPQKVATRAVAPTFSSDGNFRGHYMQAYLKHTFNKHINGHLWAEAVWQGDYYKERDLMLFLRPEIMFVY
ncbi:MAG: alginate export family protein [Verrucomicrobia bacterium]|nr:alginate export family protein [Verrucomicrobiota bacterium]